MPAPISKPPSLSKVHAAARASTFARFSGNVAWAIKKCAVGKGAVER